MNRISVVINTYNAERDLAAVLETVKTFDEVVVCDMESTDNTCEIAKQYGCKIVTFEKKDYVSAEPARTFAIQSASSPWVLVLDADELVTPELHDYLYARIKEKDCPAGLYIPRKNYFMQEFMHASYPDYQLRFFIKEGTVWPPYVHTFPTVNGRLEHIPQSRKDLAMIHLSDPIKSMLNKQNLYTENEIIKRAGTKVTYATLFFKPIGRFLRSYIFKGGFRNGKAGLIQAVLSYNYKFFSLAKILESQRKGQKDKY